MTTQLDVDTHLRSGSWRELEQAALKMVASAEAVSGSVMAPKLGGGTRIMLALHHRISDDIDLFIRDPQWIGYLTPRLNDSVEALVTGYDESSSALKLAMPQGEIDFIVGLSLLGLPDEKSPLSAFALEPIQEVMAKKLFYRGWALTPRDLFDWHAVETQLPGLLQPQEFGPLLKGRIDGLMSALALMANSSNARSVWEKIRAPDKPALLSTIDWATKKARAFVATPSPDGDSGASDSFKP